MSLTTRRAFLRELGVATATLPFVEGLPSLRADSPPPRRPRQRLVLIFTPNGIVPPDFWPDATGTDFTLKRILAPLEPFRDRLLILKGISNKVRGDGDGHMRGMSCLLTAIELLPGNIQGGSDTPAGWSSGISIDQELKRFLQASPETRTRFGSLEFGVGVPNRADPWTRWSYAGPNQPTTPVSDPYLMFEKLYGQMKDRDTLASILDPLQADLRRVAARVSPEDRALLDRHATLVRELELELQGGRRQQLLHPEPALDPGLRSQDNDALPQVFAWQTDLLVNALANDLTRIATLQFTNSVGQARFTWVGVPEAHHNLSHDPDLNAESQEKLIKINVWLCEQVAALARKLDAIPEPDGAGTLLDHTTLLWTNELGKGNSHTLDNIPFVLVGGGLGFPGGRSLGFERVAHNRLWLAIAHAFGHSLETFGNPTLSAGGPLDLS